MGLILKVIDGPRKNTQFRIFHGIVLGRKRADINLDDPKASSRHARIEEGEDKSFFLIDNESRNGIVCEGQRVDQLELEPGVVFLVGDSTLQVFDEAADVLDETGEMTKDWASSLAHFCSKLGQNLEAQPQQIGPLDPAVELRVIQGPQIHQTWTLGYGPRLVGAKSSELTLFDSEAPDQCFEIHPGKDGPTFYCADPEKVKFNDKKSKMEKLRDGDQISVGQTILQVNLLDV